MQPEQLSQFIVAMQKTAATDESEAKKKLESLFAELMEQNCFYVIAESGNQPDTAFLPYIAPVQEGADLQMIRIYCTAEEANRYINSNKDLRAIRLETVQMVQFAKYWFLRGVFGFMLDDGNVWCAIQLEDFIRIFWTDLVGDSSKVSPHYVPLIQFARDLHLQKRSDIIFLEIQREKRAMTYYLVGESESTEVFSEAALITMNEQASVVIECEPYHIETTVVELREAFRITEEAFLSLQPVEMLPAGKLFDGSKDYPFLNSEAGLIFSYKEKESVLISEPVAAPLNTPKSKVQRHLPKFKLPAIPFKKWIIGAFAAIFIFVVLLFTVREIGAASANRMFSAKMATGEYQQAVEIYEENKHKNRFVQMANAKAEDEVGAIYNSFISGDVSAQEAIANIQTLSQIPGQKDLMLDKIAKINAIDKSRQAFELGCNASKSMERLYDWSFVIPEDTANYQAVQDELAAAGNKYLINALHYIDALVQANDIGMAKAYLLVLDKLFPQTESILKRLESLEGVTASKLPDIEGMISSSVNPSKVPVAIHQIHASSPTVDGAVDLFIEWKNTGTKAISEIDFYVIPYNEEGIAVSTRDGSYSMYCARDLGPYKVGQGTPSDTWKWTQVWYNSNIKSVAIQQIIIIYTDGTVGSIEGKEAVNLCFRAA